MNCLPLTGMSTGQDEYYKRYKAAITIQKSNCRGSSAASYQMLANLYKNKMNQPEKAKTVLEEFRKKSNNNCCCEIIQSINIIE
jgi:hypothetical protein